MHKSVIIKSDRNNLLLLDTAGKQVVVEQIEEQIALSASSYAGNHLNKPVLFFINQLVKVEVSFNYSVHYNPPFTKKLSVLSPNFQVYYSTSLPGMQYSHLKVTGLFTKVSHQYSSRTSL